jgi:hypothetical protein
MANRRHRPRQFFNDTATTENHRGSSSAPMPERTANWPGLPGKTQPGGRGGGVKKCKCYPSSEGI